MDHRLRILLSALAAVAAGPATASAAVCSPARTAPTAGVCWTVPKAPVRVTALSRGDVVVRFTAQRRLRLAVAGRAAEPRRRTVLRPGRRVLVRVDATRTRVRLLVGGRLEAVARRAVAPTAGGPAAERPAGRPKPAAPGVLGGVAGIVPGVVDAVTGDAGVARPSGSTDPRPFAPTSFWNAPLADDARLSPQSPALVGELMRQVRVHDPWLNTTRYSTPVHVVGPDQPGVRVTLDQNAPALQREWESVPIPATAVPAEGNDKHLVVWQPSSDRMWEFWATSRQPDGWHARWGGAMRDVSMSPGHFGAVPGTEHWGATATGLPLLGGLITLDELRRGRVDHALAIAVVEARKDVFVWPAQRDDGTRLDAAAIPEGTRFRLDPQLDVEALPASPFVKLLARAAQRHGIVVRDTAGSVAFFGEDPTPTGSDPWPAVWEGGWPNHVLRGQFPWHRLQVVAP